MILCCRCCCLRCVAVLLSCCPVFGDCVRFVCVCVSFLFLFYILCVCLLICAFGWTVGCSFVCLIVGLLVCLFVWLLDSLFYVCLLVSVFGGLCALGCSLA